MAPPERVDAPSRRGSRPSSRRRSRAQRRRARGDRAARPARARRRRDRARARHQPHGRLDAALAGADEARREDGLSMSDPLLHEIRATRPVAPPSCASGFASSPQAPARALSRPLLRWLEPRRLRSWPRLRRRRGGRRRGRDRPTRRRPDDSVSSAAAPDRETEDIRGAPRPSMAESHAESCEPPTLPARRRGGASRRIRGGSSASTPSSASASTVSTSFPARPSAPCASPARSAATSSR